MKPFRALSIWIAAGAIAAPLAATAPGCGFSGVARADEMPPEIAIPRNQSEFDKFATTLGNTSAAERNAQLDRAGNAFDNGESRLFWFTDLDAARAQAKLENKPILSLRLLGNLSDELSCANSRLFRVLLYPNAEINHQLRENFVLHWSSERPVPVATIDMGDGRVMKRTLTGNSAHYLLSADGMPLDALPGLYAPAEFSAWLQRGADFARDWRAMNVELQPKMLGDWHRGRLIDILKKDRSFQPIEEANRIIAANFLMSQNPTPLVTARAISGLAMPKSLGERPILNAFDSSQKVSLLADVPLADVPLIVGLFRSSNSSVTYDIFDAATRARIAAMQPENAPQLLIRTLEVNVARDTQNNRRNFEPAIHAYFVNQATPESVREDAFSFGASTNPYLSDKATSGLIKPEPFGARKNAQFGAPAPTIPINREFVKAAKPDFVQLNRAIYDKLFRTPASDPWLGLAPADAFVALRNGGVQAATSGQRVAQQP